MKNVRQLLDLSRELYEDMIFDLYQRWCESVTTDCSQFQQVIANSAINAWFIAELKKNEQAFLNTVSRYDNLTSKDYLRCYTELVHDVFNRRPMALLEPIVKIKSTITERVN